MSVFTKFIKNRYTDDGVGLGSLDFSNIAKDLGAATALYGIVNPNDSSGLANFFGTGRPQQPVGYTGGIPNYTATRELAPNAFASTYTTPDGELATRRPGMAGRRYFTDTQFTQSADEPLMGATKEQIAAQNQAAIDDQALFESILGGVEAQRVADAATPVATPVATTDSLAANSGMGPIGTAEQIANNTAATTTLTVNPQFTLEDVNPVDGFDAQEQSTIANIIASGQKSIGEIADLYDDVERGDVVEGLLRGNFKTPAGEALSFSPARIADMSDEITEPQLIAALLEQGRTTPEEVAVYYKDHPVYGGLTPESVIEAFRDLGGKRQFAQGGMLNGATDGMADQIPATIDNMQPAALSDGEFVIPADVVSHLGNGNSDAGAQNLYSMMERVRTDRTGNPEQGRQIDPNKYLA